MHTTVIRICSSTAMFVYLISSQVHWCIDTDMTNELELIIRLNWSYFLNDVIGKKLFVLQPSYAENFGYLRIIIGRFIYCKKDIG